MELKINRSLGFILLSVYLILVGIAGLAAVAIPPILMSILALLAGILILVGM